ncbi:MAG: exodeoxyribonuclease V subunit gamma, partial [Burkholderiales bacterium]
MLTIHFANRYERLAGLLIDRLAERTRPSVFAPDQVIVPSAAVRRQLTLAIARRHGICANVRFDYLAQWLWSLIARVVPGVQAESPFAPGVLAWRIFAAFDEPAWFAPQPRLRDYLARADAVMRYELATQLAELFDQYITFRPDWLAAWAEARTLPIAAGDAAAAADQAWQAALWQRLGAEAGAEHPAAAFARMLESRGAALVARGQLPDEVHVFALPSLAPLHLGLLQTLGRCADVHVYALNPCREYWLEVVDRRRLAYLATRSVPGRELHHEVGNRLLAGWGVQTKAQLGLLIAAAGDAVIDEAHFDEPEGASLLARLQRSILDMEDLAPSSVTLAPDDRSIEVHVCHSLARELEVLHDRLLALFATPDSADAPQLSDILVVTPDLDAAAPLIDAVFGTVPADRRIAHQITGRARSHVNASARVLLEVLALVGSRFTASSVFGVLQQPLVARRFALERDDLDRVHAWLQDAGVHWALDADHRASFGVPAQSRHSFADGLSRLYLGYALPTHVDTPLDGMLPAGDVEGSDGVALGALWQFVDALTALRRELGAPLPAAAWPALLADVLQRFSAPDDDDALQDEREVLATIASLADELRQAAPEPPLTLDVVRHALARTLDDSARGGVPGGAVTFASMSSLRHLPYATICAIGLNDGAFPSRSRQAEFDLIAHEPRAGDRQRRTDERNLFLDLLLATRGHFYMSYTGRSVRDNAPLPPSTLVSELLDTLLPAISGGAPTAHTRLVIEHPLQAFSEEAFRLDADPRLRSFDRETAQALRARAGSPTAAPTT